MADFRKPIIKAVKKAKNATVSTVASGSTDKALGPSKNRAQKTTSDFNKLAYDCSSSDSEAGEYLSSKSGDWHPTEWHPISYEDYMRAGSKKKKSLGKTPPPSTPKPKVKDVESYFKRPKLAASSSSSLDLAMQSELSEYEATAAAARADKMRVNLEKFDETTRQPTRSRPSLQPQPQNVSPEAAELDRLKAENANLRKDLEELRKEVAALKEEQRPVQKATSLDEDVIERVIHSVTRIMMEHIEPRLMAVECRLPSPDALQTPKVAPRATPRAASATFTEHEDGVTPEIPPAARQNDDWQQKTGRKKKKGKKASLTTAAPPSTQKRPQAAVKAPVKAKTKPKLIIPKSAAVVLSLLPEARGNGVTFAEVIKRAKAVISPADYGAQGFVIKESQAGAKILELPDPSGTMANALADKLRQTVGDLVEVSRPEKTADLHITGFDDSISRDDVLDAVAAVSSCARQKVKTTSIMAERDGSWCIRIRCPVAAAKAVAMTEKFKVGWNIVRVRVLSPLPLRCFKCLGLGHTKPRCPSKEDRSKLCFRCGEPGHMAAACSVVKPRCSVCAASKQPADHVMGSRKCNPPASKGILPERSGLAQVGARPIEGERSNSGMTE